MLSHHAYLYEGPLANLDAVADAACKALRLKRIGNPDVHVQGYDKFGIEESRELSHLASLAGVGEQTLFVIGTSAITTEAQQALLKLFEEPRGGLTFVLLLPHGSVLPTLRSRMLLYPNVGGSTSHISAEAKKFLAASPKERSNMLAKILKEDTAREGLRNLLNDIESVLYGGKKPDIESLAEIAVMRLYLGDRSASLKMIFEHLAATI